MDTHERELLLHNPLLQRVVRAMQSGLPLERAVDAELNLALGAPALTDEELLRIERAINAALGRLSPDATKKLFAGTLDVKELADFFSLTVAQLARTSLQTDEARALGLEHLWGWYWEREVISYRRFMRSGRTAHDLLDQTPSFWRPGIEARPFWTLEQLDPAYETLEDAAPEILEELGALQRDPVWLPYFGVRGVRDQPLTDSPASTWNGFFFYHPFRGRFDANHERCPVTSRVLEALPNLCRRELVLFSALVPGSVVPPHQGPFNGRLRVHLALTGAKGCYLRVGTQIREWEDGKVLVFDDSFEHQVCHHGPQTRVVLMMNVLQPGFAPDAVDRAVLTTTEHYTETPAERVARETLAHTAWWKRS
jgi:Aspartyl/Asparaginyl beta-hydroxylase